MSDKRKRAAPLEAKQRAKRRKKKATRALTVEATSEREDSGYDSRDLLETKRRLSRGSIATLIVLGAVALFALNYLIKALGG